MARESIYRGEDKVIEFTFSEDGSAVSIDGLRGLLIVLYYQKNNKVLAKYSRDTISGFDPITTVASSSGIVSIMLQSETTQVADLGNIDAEIKLESSSTTFSNSNFHTTTRDVVIGELKDSILKNILNS